MEFDFSKCDGILVQLRINEIRNRIKMLNSLNVLFDENADFRFLESFSDDRLLDFALFHLKQFFDGRIHEYDVTEVVEKITLNGEN